MGETLCLDGIFHLVDPRGAGPPPWEPGALSRIPSLLGRPPPGRGSVAWGRGGVSRILVFSCWSKGALVVSGRGCTYKEDKVLLLWFL